MVAPEKYSNLAWTMHVRARVVGGTLTEIMSGMPVWEREETQYMSPWYQDQLLQTATPYPNPHPTPPPTPTPPQPHHPFQNRVQASTSYKP